MTSLDTQARRDEEAAVALAAAAGVVGEDLARSVVEEARVKNASPVSLLMASGKVSDEALLAFAADYLGIQYVDLNATGVVLTVDKDYLTGLADSEDGGRTAARLERVRAIPLTDGETRFLGSATPFGREVEALVKATHAKVSVLVPVQQIEAVHLTTTSELLNDALAVSQEDSYEEESQEIAASGPIVEWLDTLLNSSAASGVSDIHIEMTHKKRLMVRKRIFGELRQEPFPLQGREAEVIAALMVRSGMDAANIREAQDGNFSLTFAGRKIDARVSMTPLVSGPKVVIRLLDSDNVSKPLESMGFTEEELAIMREHIHRSQGFVLVGGPTGSGKTTTLYGLLKEVAGPSVNVMTAENPVEYRLDFVSQMQVGGGRGERAVTFAKALRTFLRQDPDIILVGEIRDEETARTAADASITGHLVLSTIHANGALNAYSRLTEMGVARYLVADSISLLLYQRLVRKLHDCKVSQPVSQAQRQRLSQAGFPDVSEVFQHVGCTGCNGTGYRGRLPVLELVEPNDQMRAAVLDGDKALLAEALGSTRHVTLEQSAMRLVASGQTDFEEAHRVVVGL